MMKKTKLKVLFAVAAMLTMCVGVGRGSAQAGVLDGVKDFLGAGNSDAANGQEYAEEEHPAAAIAERAAAIIEAYLDEQGIAYEYADEYGRSCERQAEEENGYIIEAGDELTTNHVGYSIYFGDNSTAYLSVGVSWKKGRGELNRLRLYSRNLPLEQDQAICTAVFSNDLIDGMGDSVTNCRNTETIIAAGKKGSSEIKYFNNMEYDQGAVINLDYYGNVMLKEIHEENRLSLMDYTVLAGELKREGDLFYYLSDAGAVALLYNGYGESESIIVPEQLGGEPVTRVICDEYLGEVDKHYSDEDLKTHFKGSYCYIAIPATAKEVGCVSSAFLNRSILLLPESVEKVNEALFLSSHYGEMLCFGTGTEVWKSSRQDVPWYFKPIKGLGNAAVYSSAKLAPFFEEEKKSGQITTASFEVQYLEDVLEEIPEDEAAIYNELAAGDYTHLEEMFRRG